MSAFAKGIPWLALLLCFSQLSCFLCSEEEALLLEDKDFCTVPGAANVKSCDWIVEQLEEQNPGLTYDFFCSNEEDCDSQFVEGEVVDWFSGGCNGPKIINKLCGCCVFIRNVAAGPPTNLAASEVTDSSATITWTDGAMGFPTETYTVRCFEEEPEDCRSTEFVEEVTGIMRGTEEATISDLEPNTMYTCFVLAVNPVEPQGVCSDALAVETCLQGLQPREVDGVCIAPPGEILMFDAEGNPVPATPTRRKLLINGNEFNFPSIQEAVEAAGEDFVIYVGIGRFAIDLTGMVEEGIQLLGANFGIDARDRDVEDTEFESVLETTQVVDVPEDSFSMDGFFLELVGGRLSISVGSSNVVVANNIFTGTTQDSVFGALHIQSDANFATVSQNKFRNIRRDNPDPVRFFQANAVFLGQPSGVVQGFVLTRNEFTDIGNQGITSQQDSFDTVLIDFLIEDNSFMDTGGICIQMYARVIQNGFIQGNTMQRFNVGRERAALWFRVAGVPTDRVESVTIAGNIINGEQQEPEFEGSIGIHFTVLESDPTDYIDVVVRENQLENNKIGLLVTNLGADGAEAELDVLDNTFSGNGRFETGNSVGAQVELEGTDLPNLADVLAANEFDPDSEINPDNVRQIIQIE